ncbi:MAG: aminopeptidase P family protein [Actinomycetota bacterium]|nr:aminopeptidase P family protein [Actinomycetota bacterium]
MNGASLPSSRPALPPPAAAPGPPRPDHRRRRDRLRARAAEHELAALYVTDLRNVRWLTGFTGTNGQVLVADDPELDVLITDARYATQAAAEAPDLPHMILRSGGAARMVERLATAGIKEVGFEADRLSWEAGEGLRRMAREAGLVARAAGGHVEALRAVKDAHEVSALRIACAITVTAFGHLVTALRPGLTERAAAVMLDRTMIDLGAEAPAFETIVASGPNSAIPHHRPTARQLCRGELVKFDFGARHAGYHADMSRTVALGDPGEELGSVYDLVRRAHRAGVVAAVAGAAAGDVDRACRELIAAGGRGEQFLHPTGHGVGLAIHEWPTLAKEGRATLETGMTVTVEPGVYLAGVGGVRIEDTILVTASGPPHILTSSPYDLTVL